MFKGLRDAFKTSANMWNASGYWAEVVVEYGKLTNISLEHTAKVTGDQHLLDHFCAKAKDKGLTASQCATLIYQHGFHDVSVI